jgi:hypothetical protein
MPRARLGRGRDSETAPKSNIRYLFWVDYVALLRLRLDWP